MDIKCKKCGAINQVQNYPQEQYRCGQCNEILSKAPPSDDNSQAVGLIGGAALGAALGGPTGAIIGGIIGSILGKKSKETN